MNPVESVLAGVTAYVPGSDPISRLVRQHLVRMGAIEVADATTADIAVAESQDSSLDEVQGIVCELEEFRLDDGALIASETTAQAALDLPTFIGASGGRPDRSGADIASSVAAFLAVQTVCAVRFGMPEAGAGTRFRTSHVRGLSMLKSLSWAARSRPDAWVGTHVRSREKGEDNGYRTADGRITLDFAENNVGAWRGYCESLGLSSGFIETHASTYMRTVGWGDDVDAARPIYEASLRQQSTDDATDLIIKNAGSSVPFLSVGECLAHPQAVAVGLDLTFDAGLPFRITVRGDRPMTRTGELAPAGGPLAGIRVLDLGVGGVGPFASSILGRLGADVVRVEPPFDFVHTIGPWTGGLSTTYLACNTAKRSIALNLKDGSDRRAFLDLVTDADVVNANFRSGSLERLGLGFDDLIAVNPNIVLATTTGYGWAGPMADQPCTDPHAQAFAGFAVLNARPPSNTPRRCRYVGFIDVVTSTVIAEGVGAALLVRDTRGGAMHMETSMMHAVCEAAQTVINGPHDAAPDDVFRAADGYFALTCRNERDWKILVGALDDPSDVVHGDFATATRRLANREQLRGLLERQFATKAALGWVLQLARAGVPAVRLIDDDEALARLDYRRVGLVRSLRFGTEAPILVGGNGVVFPGHEPVDGLTAPTPCEHDATYRSAPSEFWRGERSRRPA